MPKNHNTRKYRKTGIDISTIQVHEMPFELKTNETNLSLEKKTRISKIYRDSTKYATGRFSRRRSLKKEDPLFIGTI